MLNSRSGLPLPPSSFSPLPFSGAGHKCLTALCLRYMPLLSLHCALGLRYIRTSFHYDPFAPFVHSAAQTSATHASVVPSLHSVHCPPFVPSSNSFGFFPEVALYTTKTPLLNFTPAKSLHFVQSLPLPFPAQLSGMPCVMFTPGKHSSLSKYLKITNQEEDFLVPRIFSHLQPGCY